MKIPDINASMKSTNAHMINKEINDVILKMKTTNHSNTVIPKNINVNAVIFSNKDESI
ncbi:MAG: hypothetical protein QXD48_00965 [Candidatus Aenigmatarchaeota archaeon]